MGTYYHYTTPRSIDLFLEYHNASYFSILLANERYLNVHDGDCVIKIWQAIFKIIACHNKKWEHLLGEKSVPATSVVRSVDSSPPYKKANLY